MTDWQALKNITNTHNNIEYSDKCFENKNRHNNNISHMSKMIDHIGCQHIHKPKCHMNPCSMHDCPSCNCKYESKYEPPLKQFTLTGFIGNV